MPLTRSARPMPGGGDGLLSSPAWSVAVAIGAAMLGGHVPATAVLAIAVVAGLTHGAGDMAAGRRAFGRASVPWWVPFLASYLALVAATLALWAIAPTAALIGFLLLSAIHFGTQDAGAADGAPSPIAIAAHGATVMVVPALCHPDAIRMLFAMLVGAGAGPVQALLAGPVAMLWLAAVAVLAVDTAHGRRGGRSALGRLAAVAALFAAAPPLVAFGLYFAALHTPRALATQRRSADRAPPLREIAGVTALACLLGLIVFLVGPHLGVDAGIVRTSFVLLSALTVPHMALDYAAPMPVSVRPDR